MHVHIIARQESIKLPRAIRRYIFKGKEQLWCSSSSYGSNSTAQLKSRVKKPSLVSKGAHLDNYARIFCLKSSGGWRTRSTASAVASIYPSPHSRVYGAVVELNEEELKRLDTYEGGYTKKGVITSEGEAVAYIANNQTWTNHLPSEQLFDGYPLHVERTSRHARPDD